MTDLMDIENQVFMNSPYKRKIELEESSEREVKSLKESKEDMNGVPQDAKHIFPPIEPKDDKKVLPSTQVTNLSSQMSNPSSQEFGKCFYD